MEKKPNVDFIEKATRLIEIFLKNHSVPYTIADEQIKVLMGRKHHLAFGNNEIIVLDDHGEVLMKGSMLTVLDYLGNSWTILG